MLMVFFSEASLRSLNLILILSIIWTLQFKKIHVITMCTVMTPTHGDRVRDSFDWWGFKKRLNDRNKSGFKGHVGLTDVCNKTVWSGLIKEQLHQAIPCNPCLYMLKIFALETLTSGYVHIKFEYCDFVCVICNAEQDTTNVHFSLFRAKPLT